MTRCDACPRPHDGSPCLGARLRYLCSMPEYRPVLLAHADDTPPEPVALIPLADNIRLTLAASRCPHRTEPGCGCPGVPGSCALGKYGGSPTLGDCISCQRRGGPGVDGDSHAPMSRVPS